MSEIGPHMSRSGPGGGSQHAVGCVFCEVPRSESELEAGPFFRLGDDDVELPCNVGYSLEDAMTTFPQENSDRVYELLSNVLVDEYFMTGAIWMDALRY
jgi:hypothetical protein